MEKLVALSMGIFASVVLFSDVQGIVLRNGVPVVGAEIVQQVSLNEPGDIPPRTVRTDAQGRFGFDAVTQGAGIRRLVPHQPAILQRILIRHEGVEYQGWRHTKNSYEPNSELDGKPLRLVCELTQTPGFEGKHYGICRVAAR